MPDPAAEMDARYIVVGLVGSLGLALLILTFGVVIPWLVSAHSDTALIIAFALALACPTAAYLLGRAAWRALNEHGETK